MRRLQYGQDLLNERVRHSALGRFGRHRQLVATNLHPSSQRRILRLILTKCNRPIRKPPLTLGSDGLNSAGIIDFLTMYPEARRRVVRLLAEIDAVGE
jgi:hypothetical protein